MRLLLVVVGAWANLKLERIYRVTSIRMLETFYA